MAELAGNVAVPFGSVVPAEQDVKSGKITNPLEAAAWACFQDLSNALSMHWPNLKGQTSKDAIHIVFDDPDFKEWRNQILDSFEEFKKADPRFGHITPGDDEVDIPLQAADLYVAAGRQQGETKADQPRVLDFLLSKNVFPKNHPKNFHNAITKMMNCPWDEAIKRFRQNQKEFRIKNPKTKYLPLEHYPFEKHIKK